MTLPAIDDLDTYISVPELQDYLPVTDPNTDVPAAGLQQVFANAAMSTRTQRRAYVVFQWDGANITLIEHDAVWGDGFAVTPVVTRSGTGHFVVTWPATVTDPIGVDHDINLRRMPPPSIESLSTPYFAIGVKDDPNAFSVYIRHGGTASPSDPTNVDIFAEVL